MKYLSSAMYFVKRVIYELLKYLISTFLSSKWAALRCDGENCRFRAHKTNEATAHGLSSLGEINRPTRLPTKQWCSCVTVVERKVCKCLPPFQRKTPLQPKPATKRVQCVLVGFVIAQELTYLNLPWIELIKCCVKRSKNGLLIG